MTRTHQRRIAFIVGIGLLTAAGSAFAATETFTIDKAHTLFGFRIRHFVSKVEGRFKDFEGTITLDRQNPSTSKVELTIQATSIDTANENRDKDLRSANFFDVEKFPTITFKSTKVDPKGSDSYDVTGDLMMHGITKPVKLTVKHGGFIKAGKVGKGRFRSHRKAQSQGLRDRLEPPAGRRRHDALRRCGHQRPDRGEQAGSGCPEVGPASSRQELTSGLLLMQSRRLAGGRALPS